MIKQENKRQEERRQIETKFETKGRLEERIRQEEFRRRQEEIMREQEEMFRLEEFRRRQEEMYIQEERIREQEMIRRENELRKQVLLRRNQYSVTRRPQIRSPIYPIAQMENQMIAYPIYRRREEFENREVNPNDILNQFAITKLKNINSLNNDSKNCTICLEYFKKGDKVIYLPCIHFFHEMCIKNWIKIKQFCPVCKLEINNNNNLNNY